MDEQDIRASERSIIREWLYGRLIDLTWQGVKDIRPGSKPKPWGRIREARSRGIGDALDVLEKRDDEARDDYWQTGGVTYGFLWPAVFGKSPERFESDEREPGSWFVGTDGKADR
jgi:hypothetical protein